MKPKQKPILCLDFDGVIHSYDRGWHDGTIYGVVTPGFFEWANEAKHYFRLVIYSSRSKTAEGRKAMHDWMMKQWSEWKRNGGESGDGWLVEFEYAHEKPPAFLTIDDRCMVFAGQWALMPPSELAKFKPWTEKGGIA